MNATVEDLRPTIIPRSDQLNADQLLGGEMTITVTDVRIGSGEDQPVSVHYQGDNGRPFKPCKTMRKLLIHAWGANGRDWRGRSMTLYNDPGVKFGGEDVGGVRISSMTDIPRDIKVSLTSARGKKAKYEVKRMAAPSAVDQRVLIANAATIDALQAVFGAAYKATKDAGLRDALKTAYDARKEALSQSQAAAFDFAAATAKVNACTDPALLDLMADDYRTELPDGEERRALFQAIEKRHQEIRS